MKFKVNQSIGLFASEVKYIANEFSIQSYPVLNQLDYGLTFNSLNLNVLDNEIKEIWGYLGDVVWKEFDLVPPKAVVGQLLIDEDLEFGFNYRINKTVLPIFQNKTNGWICIGDPYSEGESVEFVKNCIATLDLNGKLLSIWINIKYA